MKMNQVAASEFKRNFSICYHSSKAIQSACNSPEELPDDFAACFFLSDNARQGFYIKSNGTINCLYSLDKGKGRELVAEAIRNGARRLDCFDGYLVKFYSSLGFVEISREPNWTIDGPDVVYMALPLPWDF